MQALIFIEAFGKVPAWSRISHALGLKSEIIATSGHLCRYPDSLYPLGIKVAKGQAIDVTRVVRPEIDRRIRNALRARDPEAEIIIATDDDPEGDVIALDVMRVIVDVDPMLIDSCIRIRPGAITKEGIEVAIAKARDNEGGIDDLVSRAVSGRTRALTDRWMGATLSRLASAGCGRVRAGILGAALCWRKSPELVRDLPETGEMTFQCRSGAGGLPFTAQVSLKGTVPEALASVARRYAGKLIPGQVNPMKSVGAAVAPRLSNVTPFNTGDALAYASRFHGVGTRAAMAGLQSAYMKGRISYPRTDNRTISQASAAHVIQAARICGLRDVDMRHAAKHAHTDENDGITAHEGIYPTPRMTKDDMDRFRSLVKRPIKDLDPKDPAQVEDLMVTLVARRIFEALRDGELAPGVFHPREDSDLTEAEREALADLEWTRPLGQSLPWGRAQATALRIWPLASVLVDGMMIEQIGRPSTWASHADQVEQSGQIIIPAPGALPEPSPHGIRILKALPRGIWNPETCRMIEHTMSIAAADEDLGAEITHRMRSRVDVWFSGISREVRNALVEMLKSESESAGRAPSKAAEGIRPVDVDPDLDAFADEEPETVDMAL